MVKYNTAVFAGLILLAVSGVSNAADTIAEQQADQIEQVLIDMNKSAKEVADTVISDPQNAIDAGCLDDIQGIDLSVFTVDFTNIWGALYQQIKDGLVNAGCTASTDWINQQTAMLDGTLTAPLGLGSISISQGSAVDDWQSVVATDVEMDSSELVNQVSTDTLGNIPGVGTIGGATNRVSSQKETPASDKSEYEAKIKDMLDVKQLYND